ncbi:hypothetical protein [Halopiger djelfimassiliensis]|uniref:hypothetical protein n=1 Tax=Halopiger djelfimassiliensis TaxID=1293047 RepID=UPI0012B5C384
MVDATDSVGVVSVQSTTQADASSVAAPMASNAAGTNERAAVEPPCRPKPKGAPFDEVLSREHARENDGSDRDAGAATDPFRDQQPADPAGGKRDRGSELPRVQERVGLPDRHTEDPDPEQRAAVQNPESGERRRRGPGADDESEPETDGERFDRRSRERRCHADDAASGRPTEDPRLPNDAHG